MSGIRDHSCGAPGPYGSHCTDYPGHEYSCYDAGDDVSFNERAMRDEGITHGECKEDGCDG